MGDIRVEKQFSQERQVFMAITRGVPAKPGSLHLSRFFCVLLGRGPHNMIARRLAYFPMATGALGNPYCGAARHSWQNVAPG